MLPPSRFFIKFRRTLLLRRTILPQMPELC